MSLTLRKFCEKHGKSYEAAKVNGIGKLLIASGAATWKGCGYPIVIKKGAKWPKKAAGTQAKEK